MNILGRIPVFGSEDEDDNPEYEVIFKGSSEGHEPYAEDDELVFNPHQMLGDTIGEVDVSSNNPYGPKEIHEEVSSVKALKLFDDTGKYVSENFGDGEFNVCYNLHIWDDGRIEYTMSVSDKRTGINRPEYDPTNGMEKQATSFRGKLAESVSEEEVERFVSQYGFDRHVNGWEFDNLEDNLDEFLEPEDYGEVFEVPSGQVQQAIVYGEVRLANYLGDDYSHWEDREIIGALLEDSSETAEVREVEHSGVFNYEVFVEEDDVMGGEEIRLEIVSREPIFSTDKEIDKGEKVAEASG